MRGEKIMKNSKLLEEGKMTPDEFLQKIVYKQSEDDFGLLNTINLNPIIDIEDDDENEDVLSLRDIADISEIAESSPIGRCLLCSEKRPEMCIVPCFDFCVCEPCYHILKNNAVAFNCPKCNIVATDAKKMNFM